MSYGSASAGNRGQPKPAAAPAPARIIDAARDIRSGVRALRRACPVMRHVHTIAGDPPLRRRPAGFEGLARIVIGQQLSVASAGAIWNRLTVAIDPFSAATMSSASDAQLRAAGLSGAKIRTLRAITVAIEGRQLQIEQLSQSSDADVHRALTAISGIGPWTADIFIMFCLGRADAFAAGDLALQVAAQHAAGLEQRPTPDQLIEMAQVWRPWRGVAARLLWTYYPHIKKPSARRQAKDTAAEPI